MDKPTGREVLLAIGVALSWLILAGWLDERDIKIKLLEQEMAARQGCEPQHDGEIAAMARVDGRIECMLHTGEYGQRKTRQFMVY